jgi:hypothetical protein
MPTRIELVDFVWYVPKFQGNRARWESGEDPDPWAIEICPTSYGDSRRSKRAVVDDDWVTEYRLDHTRSIRNLWIGEEHVTEAKRLWEVSDRLDLNLVKELHDAIFEREHLDEGTKKN